MQHKFGIRAALQIDGLQMAAANTNTSHEKKKKNTKYIDKVQLRWGDIAWSWAGAPELSCQLHAKIIKHKWHSSINIPTATSYALQPTQNSTGKCGIQKKDELLEPSSHALRWERQDQPASTTKSSRKTKTTTRVESSNDSGNSGNSSNTATAATMGTSPGHAPHMLACLAASGDSGIHSSIHALWTTTTATSPDVWQWVVYTAGNVVLFWSSAKGFPKPATKFITSTLVDCTSNYFWSTGRQISLNC